MESDLGECPVCGAFIETCDLLSHVNQHFDDSSAEGDPGIAACGQCGAQLPISELDAHEEAHRLQAMEEEEAQLQQHQRQHQSDVEEQQFAALQAQHGFSDKRPGRCFTCGEEGHWSVECPRNPRAARRPAPPLPSDARALAARQRAQPLELPATACADAIPSVLACLQSQTQGGYRAYLCGPVRHLSAGRDDSGWGCGYRNIQMLASHMLAAQPAARAALFGGAGFVPDVASLQAWLEAAWAQGFDHQGAEQLGGAVQGTRKWIGTTEAAALLRSFGVRAHVVDFHASASSLCG